MSIPSLYNFVPLSGKVILPDWSSKVSHDIPLRDGVSGHIDITVEAKTPVYVRNGGYFPDNQTLAMRGDSYRRFFSIRDKYYIPGSSLKGAIRNVVEIISFSKIKVDDKRYSFRDLANNDDYKARLTTDTNNEIRAKAKAGWLVNDENSESGWSIIPCSYARIEQASLERAYTNNLTGNIQIGQIKESAGQKYAAWQKTLDWRFNIEQNHEHERQLDAGKTLIYDKAVFDEHGGMAGTIVFTGQPAGRDQEHAKHMEFVFYTSRHHARFPVPVKVKKEFIFIHSDTSGKPNMEWKFWQVILSGTGHPRFDTKVPIFYIDDPEAGLSFGLAMMYRFPYSFSVGEIVVHTQKKEYATTPDFSETMFGFVHEKKALKGRVHFSPLAALGTPVPLTQVRMILGSPKPTYYPTYLKQDPKADDPGSLSGMKYKTFNDTDAEIRGWKRYPAGIGGTVLESPVAIHNDARVATEFVPLAAGTRFEGKIRFFNLKKEELGALLWALTWGNSPGLRHSLGMAKPYKYGSLSIEVRLGNLVPNSVAIDTGTLTINGLINCFVEYRRGKIKQEAIDKMERQLLAMANPNSRSDIEKRYPTLATKEFSRLKSTFKILKPYA